MSSTTIGITEPSATGPRLTAAMDVRLIAAGLSLAGICRDTGIFDRKLRAWRGGENEPPFSEIERLDTYFAARGQPGLIADMRKAAGWSSERLRLSHDALPPLGRKLLDCLPDLRGAVSVDDMLAERGLQPYVHIMLRGEGDKVFLTHRGGKMASAGQIDRSVFGRDIRLLAPQGYGIEVYPQVMECLTREEPALHHISSPDADYYRIAVPVGPFYVAHSFRITWAPEFVLR